VRKRDERFRAVSESHVLFLLYGIILSILARVCYCCLREPVKLILQVLCMSEERNEVSTTAVKLIWFWLSCW
jgi:uncharacterized membrane protein YjdF